MNFLKILCSFCFNFYSDEEKNQKKIEVELKYGQQLLTRLHGTNRMHCKFFTRWPCHTFNYIFLRTDKRLGDMHMYDCFLWFRNHTYTYLPTVCRFLREYGWTCGMFMKMSLFWVRWVSRQDYSEQHKCGPHFWTSRINRQGLWSLITDISVLSKGNIYNVDSN